MTEPKKFSEGLHLKEYVVNEERSWKDNRKRIIHQETVGGPVAAFASEIIRHFAIVAGTPDGEDSSGRSKCRLATPKEVVDRACEIAALAFDAFSERGWLLETMTPENVITEESESEAKFLEAAATE